MAGLESLVRAVYPPQCLLCGALTETEFALCAACWREAHFIGGTRCDLCGVPLPGQSRGEALACDDCLRVPRPWQRGRAVLLYRDNARKLVLALKHGDRTDLARSAGVWMAEAARELVTEGTLVTPVPLHWWRLLRRRYNQAGLLAHRIAAHLGLRCIPDALVRRRATAPLGRRGAAERFADLAGAIAPHPRAAAPVAGRPVLLVDDVMTSGATLAAAAEALVQAGAIRVHTVVLARATRED